MSIDRYPIPAGEHRVEQEIQRSRFITTISPAAAAEAAREFVSRIRTEFPDATHNCWAYQAGPPGTTGAVGMSDDGEPHGTAGRPMLTVLLHSGLGEVAAVVTRYFGGTRLGKGGLVRAYTECMQQAIDSLPRAERVARASFVVEVDYAWIDPLMRLLPRHEAEVKAEAYGEKATFQVTVPAAGLAAFETAVITATNGQARLTPSDAG